MYTRKCTEVTYENSEINGDHYGHWQNINALTNRVLHSFVNIIVPINC